MIDDRRYPVVRTDAKELNRELVATSYVDWYGVVLEFTLFEHD